MRTISRVGSVLVVLALAACGGGGGGGSPTSAPTSGSASASVTPSVVPSPTTTATASPTESPTATGVTCAPFGSTDVVTHGQPGDLSTLVGEQMRVGRHDCYERFVFQMQGTGSQPWWTVGYADPLTGDASGEPIEMRGAADLGILIGVWTVTDFPGRPVEWPPFTGPDDIITSGYIAIKQAINLYAFEGITQIGIGLDKQRPFRVQWLDGPPRLVVDVWTGETLG